MIKKIFVCSRALAHEIPILLLKPYYEALTYNYSTGHDIIISNWLQYICLKKAAMLEAEGRSSRRWMGFKTPVAESKKFNFYTLLNQGMNLCKKGKSHLLLTLSLKL